MYNVLFASLLSLHTRLCWAWFELQHLQVALMQKATSVTGPPVSCGPPPSHSLLFIAELSPRATDLFIKWTFAQQFLSDPLQKPSSNPSLLCCVCWHTCIYAHLCKEKCTDKHPSQSPVQHGPSTTFPLAHPPIASSFCSSFPEKRRLIPLNQ